MGYTVTVMVSPPRSGQHAEGRLSKELAERAARIAAMLDRWEAEDVSSEPEWDVDDLEPMTFRRVPTDDHKPTP